MRANTALIGLLLAVGCATDPRPVSLSSLESSRHAYAKVAAGWTIKDNAILNDVGLLPQAEAPTESLGLFRDLAASNFECTMRVCFDRTGVAGFVFHASVRNGTVGSMHVLTLSAGGIDLWRLDGRAWILMERHVRPLAPDEPHALRTRVQGDKMIADLDGEVVFEGRDSFPAGEGRVGIYARDGVCRFESISFKSLDSKKALAGESVK